MKRLSKTEDEFEAVYNQYVRLMYSCAYEILEESALAEDAVQEAFIRIFRHRDRLDKENTRRNLSFVYTITKNVALNMYNKRKRGDIPSEYVEPKPKGEGVEENPRLYGAMASLTEEERSILLLKYVYGFTQKEIASLLKIKRSAAGVRLKRAKDKLLRLMGE